MKITPQTSASRSLPLQNLFSRARAPTQAGAPSAEFSVVAANRQARVIKGVQTALTAKLSHVPASRQAAVKELVAHVGQPDFYTTLAKCDPSHAAQWTQMAQVQKQFGAAEAKYDPKTRAYSESMRLTLHAAVIQHFADPASNQGMSLYDRFIALHPTAFHQNGGWVDNLQIPVEGAMAVAQATPLEMFLHAGGLVEGSFISDAPTVAAAQMVRDARRSAVQGWGG